MVLEHSTLQTTLVDLSIGIERILWCFDLVIEVRAKSQLNWFN
jgi:hypothetical protein